MFVFSSDGSGFYSSGAFGDKVMRYLRQHRSIDLRQREEGLTRQGRREDQDRSDGVGKADAHRIENTRDSHLFFA